MPSSSYTDHDTIRQNRLKKFLLNCAKAGVQTPIPLDAKRQDNATFDTMLEVAVECDTLGIPNPHMCLSTASPLPLPPTPKTGDPSCVWKFITDEETWTPELPEDEGGYDYPNFPEVLASFLPTSEDSDEYSDYEDYYDEY